MTKGIKHTKTITEKVTLKGILNADATTITCDDTEIVIQDYLNNFASGYAEIVFTNKSEEDLTDSE